MDDLVRRVYVDFHGNPVRYDTSIPVTWRLGAYALAVRDGNVLMVEGELTDRWELPGGAVEVHELLVEGAARECREETGYRFIATSPAPIHVGEQFVGWELNPTVYHHAVAVVFEGVVEEDADSSWSPDPNEIRRVHWVDPAELTTENTHPKDWPALQKAGLVR